MTNHVFNLTPGTPLYLEWVSGGEVEQHPVNLIGYLPERSLLVTMPMINGNLVDLQSVDSCVIRYVDGDTCYAFETALLRQESEPYPYLHLNYPQGVQGLTVRKAMRVPVNNMAIMLVMNENQRKISVAMTDISTAGAQLVSSSRLGSIGDEFSIDLPRTLGISLKGLSLPCAIRYVHEEQGSDGNSVKYCHGVEFAGIDEHAYSFVERFVQDSIASR